MPPFTEPLPLTLQNADSHLLFYLTLLPNLTGGQVLPSLLEKEVEGQRYEEHACSHCTGYSLLRNELSEHSMTYNSSRVLFKQLLWVRNMGLA